MKIPRHLKKFWELVSLNRDYIQFLGRGRFWVFVALALVVSLLNSLNYIALIPLTSAVIDGEKGGLSAVLPEWAQGLQGFSMEFWTLGILVLTTFLFKILLNVLFSHCAGLWGESYMFDLRRRVVVGMEKSFYRKRPVDPSHVLHLNNMIPKVGSYNWTTFSCIAKLLSGLVLFVSLVLVSFKFALAAIGFVLVWGLCLVPVMKLTRKWAQQYNDVLRDVQGFFLDEIRGRELIKVFGLGPKRDENLKGLQIRGASANALLSDSRAFVGSFQEFLIVLVAILILGSAKTFSFQIGFIVAYGYVFSKLLSILNEASNYMNSGLEVLPAASEVLKFTDSIAKDEIGRSQISAKENIRELAYKDIRFAWKDREILKISNFHLRSGDKILLKGKNGEGKSTLLRVMLGLVESDGSLTINGSKEVPIVDVQKYYSRFSYISQEVVIFQGSLAENIILNSGKDLQDVRSLSNSLQVNLDDYFPQWENFLLREGGGNLSGGQIQIVSIFRALIREFDVLMVDEFANHLAPKVVSAVDGYLKSLDQKIVFCISHAQLSFFNKELVLENRQLIGDLSV